MTMAASNYLSRFLWGQDDQMDAIERKMDEAVNRPLEVSVN